VRAHSKKYWDDLTGEELDPAAVEKGELEEMEFIKKSGLHSKVDRSVAAGVSSESDGCVPTKALLINRMLGADWWPLK